MYAADLLCTRPDLEELYTFGASLREIFSKTQPIVAKRAEEAVPDLAERTQTKDSAERSQSPVAMT